MPPADIPSLAPHAYLPTQLPAYYYHPHTLDSLYSRVSRYLSRSDHTMQIIVTLSIFSTHFLCLFVHVTLQVVLQDLWDAAHHHTYARDSCSSAQLKGGL